MESFFLKLCTKICNKLFKPSLDKKAIYRRMADNYKKYGSTVPPKHDSEYLGQMTL